MEEFKLIVAGGRDFNNYNILAVKIWELMHDIYTDQAVSIVSGMAKGADSQAVLFARINNIVLYKFPADWDIYGKAAGFVRNKQMGDFADGLLAFWDGKSRGTKHMIDYMTKLGKPVHIDLYSNQEKTDATDFLGEVKSK